MNRRTEANVCPIAIVGSACLLPGADSPERFWTNLLAGSDQRTEGGPEVFGTDPATPGGWGDPEHRITATKGGFVREPDIDLSGLRLPAERLAALGGVVRWPLHVARQALADAGIGLDHPVLARTGLLLGNYSFPTVESVARCVPLIRDGVAKGLRAAGLPVADREHPSGPPETLWPSGMPASVVADALGLGGPRLALDAACASALYSLELGRRYLATGQLDVVLAGAVCAADPLLIHLCFSDLHAYPDNGVSQPFAADSTGIVTGQGAGLFVLKRLSDAVRDGDTVHAVITSIGVGNDGAGAHLLAPNMNGQVDAYRLGGDTDVDYVECHATGTPLGDSTELRGLVEFFGSEVPLLGSVKGNVGHLLTVAGFTSVLKTVLAMRHGVIPATLTGPELIRPEPAGDVAERVVRKNTPWPATTRSRRAAVSAFGFGGANAHLVLDTPPAATSDATDPVALPRMAVTGLGVRLAGIGDVADLSRASRMGKPLLTDRTEERWHGLGNSDESPTTAGDLGALRVDVRTYRIPPLALGNTNEQHLALFEAADQALAEAGIAGPGPGVRSGDLPPRRIAVVVAMEMEPWSHAHRARFDIGAFVRAWCPDLDAATLDHLEARVRDAVHDPIDAAEVLSYIGNIMASRISASRNLTGPSFTVSGDVTVGARALETAALLLTDPTIEAVLVGAVDLAAGLENTLARSELARAAGEPLPLLGDGAAALVVTRAAAECTVVIDGLGFGHGTDAARRAVSAVCDQAGTPATDIEYVELTTGAAAVTALAEAYGGDPRSCAVSGFSPLVGDVQRASFLVGLVRAAVALREATLPAAPAGLLADAGTVLEGTPLFLAEAPQPWLLRERGGRRVAAVCGVDGGSAAHAVLSSAVPGPVLSGDPDVLVVPVPADDPDSMLRRLRALRDRIDNAATGAELMREAVADPVTGRYRAVLVAEDTVRLRTEIAAAERDLPAVLADGGEWATPAGSYCTADPAGPGKVAFVYPGAFTSYPGMSRDLFRLFPDLLAGFESEADAPAARYQHAALFPRAAAGMRRQDLMRHETAMIDDIPMMLAAGTNTAVLHTRLLRDVLGVRPDGAFGYSLGESSMLFALDVWAASARDDRALTASPLFQDRLRGAKTLIRDIWRLPPDLADNRVWQSRVVLAPAEQVAKALAGHDRLYLTHVNTDNETVVAGDPAQLDELAAATGFSMARAPANHVMHVDLVSPVRTDLAALNDYPIGSGAPGAMLLSAYDYAPIPAETTRDRATLADRNSHTLCRPVDFPRLVRTAYQAGFRVFVEVGPAATCTRWVTEVLRTDDRPHVAVSLDRRGAATATALAGALARLVSHGVPVRLEALLRPEPPRLTGLEVGCGGPSIVTRVRDAATAALAEAGPTATPVPNPPPEATVTPDLTQTPEMTQTPDATQTPEPGPTPTPRPVAAPAPIRASMDLVRTLAGTVSRAHRAALATQAALAERMLATLTTAPPAVVTGLPARPTLPPAAPPDRERPPGVRWDEADLLEFAGGRIANVFGAEFAEIDEYPVRVRLPEPPYLFVSRVISVNGTPGRFEPASIVTEYDIPHDAWYLVDGLVPCAVTIEAGQCDLLLISYLGIDFRNRGERVYRLLDSTLVFHGPLPRAGQTLRYEINIDRFVWNGDALLFFFNYRCYADGELILELLDACAGFFSADELENSLGVVTTDADRRRRAELTRTWFKPLVRTSKNSLTREDLALLAAGRLAEVFGPAYDQSADGVNRSIRLPDDMLRMVDEITRIDRLGGPRGIGALRAVKRLEPDGWYFRCHFTGDPVLAGSMVAEGGVQILQTYAMCLGLHMVFPDAEFQSVPGLTTSVKVRGQITPGTPEIRYEVEVTEVTLLPRPTVIADITVYDGDKPIISMKNFGVQVREKPGTPYRPGPGGVPPFLGRRNQLGEPAFINELHLAHAAKGDLGTAMGPEFDVYAQSRAPHIPNGDFQFVDRIMRLEGNRGQLRSGSRMVTEYDSPPEAWYYAQNSTPTMPNCVLMETSLQAAILCGYYLGATLDAPQTQFSIRNLDGTASLVRDIDLRGRTIRHDSTMLFSSAAGDVLQKFRYELSADGEVFYRGESLFGYHTAQSLSQQAGLDNGKYVAPWIETHGVGAPVRRLIVRPDDRWFRPDPRTGLRLADGPLRLVDQVDVVSDGGAHGKGYLFGSRAVDDADWYFDCHFHRDPVMPGSLGVEAVLQALQVYVIDSGLAEGMGPVEFRIPLDTPYTWRYRGQILRGEGDMTFEVHVRDVRRTGTGELVVVGDASVWKPGLRIYELTGVAIAVRPARSETTR